MELILYHYQGLFNWFVVGLFAIRFWLNMTIYHKIDSHIIHPNVPDNWRYIHFSEKEKEEKRRALPSIKDFSQDGSSASSRNEETLHYALTFWWTQEYQEDSKIAKLKRTANIFHVVFLVLFVACVTLAINMQGINHRYREVKTDWFYIFH